MQAFWRFVAAASWLAAAGGAAAQPATPGTESTTVSENKVLCVHQDAPTGSHIGAKNVCHTMAEWRTIHANSAEAMQDLEDRHGDIIQGIANANGR